MQNKRDWVTIMQTVDIIEEDITISTMKEIVVLIFIDTQVTFGVKISNNLGTMLKNARTHNERDNTKQTYPKVT